MPKLHLRWKKRAQQQRNDILAFYAERNGSDTYSLALDAEWHQLLNLLCDHPEMGQPTKRKEIRRQVQGNFALFYRTGQDYLEVIAVTDARRNAPLD